MGFWAFAPIVALIPYFIAIFAVLFGTLTKLPIGPGDPEPRPEEMVPMFVGIWAVVVVFALVLSGLNITAMIMYLIHAVKDQRADAANNKTMWILLIVLLGSIGRMVYFFVRVRNDVGPAQTLQPFQVPNENR
jgi:hypothetical protein